MTRDHTADDVRRSRVTRVLWITKGLDIGGIEQLVHWSAAVRDRGAFEYSVAFLVPHLTQLVDDVRSTGVPVACLGASRPFDLRWVWRLRQRLVRSPVDVVHFHSPYAAGFGRLAARTVPRGTRPRIVTTEHNVWGDYRLLTRLLNSATYGLDDVHLAVSAPVRNSIARRHRADVRVVVHGVPVEATRQHKGSRDRVRKEMGFGNDHIVIGTVANLRGQKGYPTLLAAAATVVANSDRVRFVAVGDGPQEAELKRMHSALGLGAAFRFLGQRSDAADVLAACDVFVLGSRYEGGPLAVLEALSLGLPVIATSVGVIPDVIVNGVEGLIVPPDQPRLLAEALLRVVEDPDLRARMGAAASARADSLDVEQTVRELETLYRQITLSSPAGNTARKWATGR